ncbi:hypothetical protein Bca4012_080293 [Brassica carinata]|uniref:(rape) hypothetical protein n=1 Tax=Brassica napus TaxID=3708 RepID=A0A816NDB9_BRANA|nr:unnamed protein product [Brassica napus]
MDSTSALVVKVSYGGVLRRFRVPVKANGQLDLDMASLRGKIAALFNLPLDAGFSLTYSDEDGDVVALVDDNDLFDVTNQRLKFLKIDVQLNTGMATNSIATERSGRSSSASGMPDSQNPVAIIQKGINDVMMAVPNPMRDTISKVYIDLTSKAASSSPVVGELFDCISKLGKLSISQEGTPCSPITKPGSSVPSAGEKKDISKKSQTGKKPATSGHVPNSMGVGASFNECPFSGVNGSSPNPMNLNKYPLGVRHSKKGSNDDYWTSSLGVFHKGIQSGISVEPNDNQRTTMRELARQRTQQRQKEEEERARDQRAKALAKLEELNRRSQLAGESSVKNLEAAHNASTPDMPEVPLSHSPASREKKTTVTAEDSIEVTEDSGKTLLPSPEDANNEGSTQHDNPPRHQVALPQNRNAWVISRSKISYLRKTLGKLSISQEGTPCSPVTKPGSSVPSAGEKKDISKKSQAGKNPTGFADSKTSRHVPNSWGVGASFNECPFSGVNGSSPNPMNLNKYPLGVRHSKKGSNDDYWTSSLGVFHKGIQCDGCEVVPITGPRFKSKVKEDYDLCNNCFSVMGNEWDYTRMDEPVSVRHLHPFGGQRVPFSNPWLGPALPPHHGVSDFRSTWTKLDSRFVLDVNVIDGTVVAPSAAFTKIWKMRNNGSLVWPRGTQIFWIGGDRFSNSFAVDLQIPAEGVPINGELDVKVDFVAPELPGRYISYWMMASPIGVKFGQRVWVSINVDASLKGTDANEFHGLNLNAFPDETFAREFTGTNVNYEPAQTGSSSVNGTLKGADLEREAAGPQIPGNDDLLVGDVEPVVPNTLTPSSSSSSSLVGFRNMRTVEALGGGYSFTMDTPAPLQEDIEKNELETTMLKELEEMGFKEIDLNKEILKENEYNLEQSVEALCGVSEWDPILEELQEMGFSDEVTNKRLLKKNNGSIKDVVMDLLTGDKEA